MKTSESPVTKPRPAVTTGNGDWAGAATAAPGPTGTAGCAARAPRYARYAGTKGSTHGETNETRPARKATAGLMPSRLGMPASEAGRRTLLGPAPRWRRRPRPRPV